jgi:hypothetical protein
MSLMRSCNPEVDVGGAPGIPTDGPMLASGARFTDLLRIKFGITAANAPISIAATTQRVRLEIRGDDRC